jgi:DNA replication protein DnaC
MSVTAALRAEMAALLKELKMPAVRECYEDEANRARAETLSYERYLLELARREAENRRVNRIERMLGQSRLPLGKTLATFDLDRLPLRVQQQIAILREGAFLDNRENILAFGNPGSGKTHLLAALGNELIQQGRRILFCHCALLVQDLLLAKEELKLPRLLKRLDRFEALIIDDIGYVEQSRDEMEVLFTLLAERYERGSVLLTSNLPFSQWERIFKDPMTTAAAIDRLVHHSVILELNVDSYRMEHAKSKAPPRAAGAARASKNPVTKRRQASEKTQDDTQ